jgi:hypothetical protein
MWKTSLGPFLGSVFGPTWERNREAYAPSPDRVWSYIADMMGQAVVAPIAEVHPSHFVYGKMIDPVFGYTALLGLAVSLVLAFRKTEWRIFWIYFLPAMFFTAGLSPYGILPNTRLHFLVPFWALASALVVQYILHRIPKFLGILAIAAWIGGASFWSLQKSFREVPKQFWLTDTTYAIELAQKLPDFRIIFVGKEWQLAGSLLKPYGLSERAEWRMEMAPEEEATLSSDPKTVVVRFSALQRRMWSPEIVQKTGFVGIRPVQ